MVVVSGAFFSHMFPDILRNKLCLIVTRIKLAALDLFALTVVCPERLFLSAAVVADHCICSIQYIRGGTVILLQLDHSCILKFLFKVQNIFNISPPELYFPARRLTNLNCTVLVSWYSSTMI